MGNNIPWIVQGILLPFLDFKVWYSWDSIYCIFGKQELYCNHKKAERVRSYVVGTPNSIIRIFRWNTEDVFIKKVLHHWHKEVKPYPVSLWHKTVNKWFCSLFTESWMLLSVLLQLVAILYVYRYEGNFPVEVLFLQ